MTLGTRHKKLPTSLFHFAQDHPEQVRIIQTPVDGRNALDFVLTLELGRMFAANPAGYFHIVSKDTDFDSIIRHFEGETKLIARYTSLAEIPALRTSEKRVARIKDEPEFIEKTIKSFIQAGLLDFTDTDKILYKLA